MNNMRQSVPPERWPAWYDGKTVNEALFCRDFLAAHKLVYTENAFFTPNGCMVDEAPLQAAMFQMLEPCATTQVTRKITGMIDLLRIMARTDNLPPQTDRVHLANGTYILGGRFVPGKEEVVRSRFPVAYRPDAPRPQAWLRFLDELLEPEDVTCLQEFIGYGLIPSNKGQRMMIIKGKGGEGKSQIGTVLARLFGCNAKNGSVGKVSENRFARADLEHIHLMIDDDMRMEALRQTNYVKSLVTAQDRMDLEKKGKQSYQGWMYARLLAFSNGDLQSLYDRSDGFYRRQLILTAKERAVDRIDDPDIAAKMCAELEGILLWALNGLERLAGNRFRFTESERAKGSRDTVKRDANNTLLFLESAGYVRFAPELAISSKELYGIYRLWCEENAMTPLRQRSVSEFLIANAQRYGIEYGNTIVNTAGRRVWGFKGMGAALRLSEEHLGHFTPTHEETPFDRDRFCA